MKILIVDCRGELDAQTIGRFAALGHEVELVPRFEWAKNCLAKSRHGEWDVLLTMMVEYGDDHLVGTMGQVIGFPLCVQAALKGVQRAAIIGDSEYPLTCLRVDGKVDEDPERSLFGFYPDFTVNDLRCLLLNKPPMISISGPFPYLGRGGEVCEGEIMDTDWYKVFCHLYPEDFPREIPTDSA